MLKSNKEFRNKQPNSGLCMHYDSENDCYSSSMLVRGLEQYRSHSHQLGNYLELKLRSNCFIGEVKCKYVNLY